MNRLNIGDEEIEEKDNEAILSEHIDRTLNSGHRTPKFQKLPNFPRLVSDSHRTSEKVGSNEREIPCYGSLPVIGRDVSSDADQKVMTHVMTHYIIDI